MENKKHILIIAALLLLTGFFFISYYSYKTAVDVNSNQLKYESLPLSSSHIYASIQKDLLKPNLIASMMAQDTFLRNWVVKGEKDRSLIKQYLSNIQDKYQTSSSFFVSDKTKTYYSPQGVVKQIDAEENNNAWYYRIKTADVVYETSIEMPANKVLTVFTNYKVYDFDNNFIGVAGIGLQTSYLRELLENYKNAYNHDIYFVNAAKDIIATSAHFQKKDDAKTAIILNKAIDQLKENSKTQQEYEYEQQQYILNIRYIDELNLYLLVETRLNDFTHHLQGTLYKNIIIAIAITLSVLFLILFNMSHHQRKLLNLSNQDNLTSLPNRKYFDQQFDKIANSTRKSDENISLILFDIDDFKKINDEFGHLIGDSTLMMVADIIEKLFRESDIVARWSGEEFIVLLRDVDNNEAYQVSEKLRLAIATDENLHTLLNRPLTVSIGVVTKTKDESKHDFFARVDKKLHESKNKGKNTTSK